MIAEGDKVVVRFTITGTQLGQWGPLPATGKPVRFEEIVILRFVDGKVAEQRGIPDNLAALRQLGVMPTPPPPRSDRRLASYCGSGLVQDYLCDMVQAITVFPRHGDDAQLSAVQSLRITAITEMPFCSCEFPRHSRRFLRAFASWLDYDRSSAALSFTANGRDADPCVRTS